MEIYDLKKEVFEANLELVKRGLVIFTWGNVSAIDRENGLVVIKPSGVEYDNMKIDDMVVVDLEGNVVDGTLHPSSDTPTHLELYRCFPEIGGVAHTHSTYATVWAQAGKDIPILGTTHADYFYGDIPCTRSMAEAEIVSDYELNTGKVIIECFRSRGIRCMETPAVIVDNHGPFVWGKNASDSVHNSVVLEQVAKMAFLSKTINPDAAMNRFLTEKHYKRKHGANAYYGQKKK